MTLDEQINNTIQPITDVVVGLVFTSVPVNGVDLPVVLIWLLLGATFFTLYNGFISFRGFVHALKLARGDYDKPEDAGEVTHFQALTAALSGTVGLGNIAGVAIAISLGGPGATFWMILAGLLGMSSKFVECTLGVKYRNISEEGVVSGGAMYYLTKGLAAKGPRMAQLGKVLAVFFAIMAIGGSFGGGNMFQANQAFEQFSAVSGLQQGWIFGLVMAVIVALVIIGGIRSIGRVTRVLVPLMCGVYVLTALVIVLMHYTDVPAAVSLIFTAAFSPDAVAGGFVGVLIQGIKRAAFSNEAGIGSAAIAHAAVKTDEPVSEGMVALLEPFIDTVVVCTMTALVIVITGMYQTDGLDGIGLTSAAFASVISWFPYLLVVAVVLFAFSTMITWSYYGLKAWTYLFGDSRTMDLTYKLLFLVFVVVGSAMQLGAVVDFSDAMIFAMSVPNMIGLYILAPEIRRDLNSYLNRLKSGEIQSQRSAATA